MLAFKFNFKINIGMVSELKLIDVLKATKRLKQVAFRTPLICSKILSDIAGCDVYLKLENLQFTNSFKFRAAYNLISLLSAEERRRGIITASSGNFGIAVACASKMLGLKSTIIMPKNTPKWKVERCKNFGGKVVLAGDNYDEAEEHCLRIADEKDLTFISGYYDFRVIAGNATIAYEILEDNPNINVILVPIGGGGLISGVAYWAKSLNPNMRIIGVQTTKAKTMYESFKAGRVVEVPCEPCLAEALAGKISEVTLNFVLKYVDDIVLVDDDKLMDAVIWTLKYEHQVVEPSGVVGIAAIIQNKLEFNSEDKVAIVVSGGNIDITNIFSKGVK